MWDGNKGRTADEREMTNGTFKSSNMHRPTHNRSPTPPLRMHEYNDAGRHWDPLGCRDSATMCTMYKDYSIMYV